MNQRTIVQKGLDTIAGYLKHVGLTATPEKKKTKYTVFGKGAHDNVQLTLDGHAIKKAEHSSLGVIINTKNDAKLGRQDN